MKHPPRPGLSHAPPVPQNGFLFLFSFASFYYSLVEATQSRPGCSSSCPTDDLSVCCLPLNNTVFPWAIVHLPLIRYRRSNGNTVPKKHSLTGWRSGVAACWTHLKQLVAIAMEVQAGSTYCYGYTYISTDKNIPLLHDTDAQIRGPRNPKFDTCRIPH